MPFWVAIPLEEVVNRESKPRRKGSWPRRQEFPDAQRFGMFNVLSVLEEQA